MSEERLDELLKLLHQIYPEYKITPEALMLVNDKATEFLSKNINVGNVDDYISKLYARFNYGLETITKSPAYRFYSQSKFPQYWASRLFSNKKEVTLKLEREWELMTDHEKQVFQDLADNQYKLDINNYRVHNKINVEKERFDYIFCEILELAGYDPISAKLITYDDVEKVLATIN